MHTSALILASSSPYRLQQLRQIGITAQTIAPSIDESPRTGEGAKELALRLAATKAEAVAAQHRGRLIIAGDQTAQLDEQYLGKPGSAANAIAQLRNCSGKSVWFYSAVCVISKDKAYSACTSTRVQFRRLQTADIEQYIAQDNPLDCAGSFKCEGLGITLFDAIDSSDPSALVGLPLIALTTLLLQCGYNPWCASSAVTA